MIQSSLSFCFTFALLCAVTSGKETDTQGTGIVYTADRRICQNITWKLQSMADYVNLTKVLNKGDGKELERQIQFNVLKSGLVNVTTTTEICCPGFYEKRTGKCNIIGCSSGTYGLNCLYKCYCEGFKKCDRRTGECKKCQERPCEDDDEGDGDDKSTVSNKDQSTTPIPPSTGKSSESAKVIGATNADNGIKYILSTIRTCGTCREFGNCASELQCSKYSDLYYSDSGLKTDPWTIISIVLSISVVGNVIALVLGFIRFRRRRQRKQSQIASVIQSTNEVNNGGESIMAESSHEYLQMTDDCHSYNALNNNRAYVSMYNELNVTHEYTDAFTPNDNDRQNMHSDMVIETARHSVANDYETVD